MKKKGINFFVFFIVVFFISIGYSLMGTTVHITGNSEVKENTWDIYFDNINIIDGSVDSIVEPTINDGLSIDFSFKLNVPGDFYAFTVDVVNDGSIDAMIDSIVKNPELTAEQAKYLNYVIEYQNGEPILSNQLLSKQSSVKIEIFIEYKIDITEYDLPSSNDNLDLSFTLNYVQSDSSGIKVKDNGISKIVSDGNINEIGTIVTIGSEKFYTIGRDGDNIKLLSMYNLYVGKECSSNVSSSCIAYGSVATGLQDENMLGYISGVTIRKGTTAFSSDEQKGENYSSYNGSIIEGYVNNYKTLLENNFGVEVNEARLLTASELTNPLTFACNLEDETCINDSYPWIYATSYWTMEIVNSNYVLIVYNNGIFKSNTCYYDGSFGVRPVISISKSKF